MSIHKPISRRTLLRGLGTTIALPWLESMSGADESSVKQGKTESPRRAVFLFVPNGMHMPDWTPTSEGELNKLTPTLQPLEAHKRSLMVLSGLTLNGARALGDGPGDHARCVAAYLTGAHPHKTDGKDIRNGISVDQAAAKAVGRLTRFPSLELGTEPSSQGGRCDSGYSCVYTSNMSWRTPTSPMTKETNPRAVFDRLFGTARANDDAKSLSQRARYRKSILDMVADDADALRRKLGARDKAKLDEYLYAVRQIEGRIDQVEKLSHGESGVADFPRPAGVPKKFDEHVRLLLDMMVLAMQTDSTRIITYMFTNAGSNRGYPHIGVRGGHHALSHHGNDPEKQAQISKINRHHVTLLSHLLDRMAAVKEPSGTLLDNSMIVYGSGIGDGNRHNHDNLPILLIGRGAGTIKSGRHLKYKENTPLANLYLAMLRRMGVETEAFSDSTGELSGLVSET
ncbi:MAG: DUF1552 domain-containing protein [Pirellulales bacterium]|nr:DUF1552 domain-containing protein [Pirellulales bacterium]